MAAETASDLAIPPQDLAPAAERTERARSVSDELEAIFGEAAPGTASPAPAARVARAAASADRPPRRRFSVTSLSAVAAAALVGVAAGSLLVKSPARHGGAPAQHPALQIAMLPPPVTPEATDAALAAPVERPPHVRTVSQTPQLEQAAPARSPHVARASHSSRHVRSAGSYAQLRAADRRLRDAYAHAIRAGTPRAILVDYRDRWASLRRREPNAARLTADYHALARELDRAAAQARSREARRGPFHPRFAPWWG